jgi:Cyclophilin type peptidyl-prolyl cis-trans isomerase/CLD
MDVLTCTNRDKSGDRDIFNEKPTREEQTIASAAPAKSLASRVAKSAVVHTTFGDIHLRLFPDQAPKAVENFVGHARSGYFDGVLFHRVIAKFVSGFLCMDDRVDKVLMCSFVRGVCGLDDSNW